jgi:autotransporter-associated beta strand protein
MKFTRLEIPHRFNAPFLCLCSAVLLIVTAPTARAQRQMENLGRGVVAMRTGASTAYIGWRLLANDPEGVGFNLYRSLNGGTAVKLNAQPITNATDFVDSTATLTVSNSWFVSPVTNGVELAASAPFGIAANAAIPVDFQGKLAPYLSVPLHAVPGNGFWVQHVWPADFDGDGEYDFALTRTPDGSGTNPDSLVEAYLRDGTFLWRMDMGYNSTNADYAPSGVSVGHADNVTAYDMDGDGKAEVLVRTANGVTVTNAAGVRVAAISVGNNTDQFISVMDGMTGVEKARGLLPNHWPAASALSSHLGIMYGDGVRPSLVCEAINRNADGSFNLSITCWDYRSGALTMRWEWTPPNDGKNYSRAHQIRIADVDHDGKDEFCEIGFVLHDDGDHATPLYSTILGHGDRYQIADLDPDRPGLETFAIQQDNGTLLATALLDASTGKPLKEWFSAGVADVARGNAGDVDPNTRGVELFSTQPGLWSCKGDLINNNPPYPNFSIWWDADLSREQLNDGKIDKYNVGRLLSPYYMKSPAPSGLVTARSAQPLYGDLFGDWREEVMFESSDHASLMIFTPVSPSTTRLVCLAQDPEYRECLTVKGYMQTTWPSYYLGTDMAAQPIAPVSDAKLVWRGNAGTNWDAGATAGWFTNNLWISNTTATVYNDGDTVLFDRTGSNNSPVQIVGTLTPGAVTVYSAGNYTFAGGSLTGGMKLTKAGAGKLILNNTNDFTGRTLITEGPFIVNGSLPNSPVTVRGGTWLDGRLGGNGVVGSAVSINEGAGVSPGQGTNSPGTLTIANNVTLAGRTRNDFDLSDDPAGTAKTNDLLVVAGNLTLQGTNTLVIHLLDTNLPPGTVYPLINYSGALSGGLGNLIVSGLTGIPYALTNPPGQIALVVKSYRASATVTWTGGQGGNAWDLLVTSNWLNGAAQDQFAPNDTVRFDDTGAANPTVNLVGDLNASNVVVDSTANYTFTGGGGIIGSAGLVKTNSGTLTISAVNNTFTGKTTIAGGTLVVSELDAIGFPSPLGNPPGGSTNLVLSGSATLRVTGESYTDRGLTLNAGTNTVDVANSGDQVTIAGQIVGAGALQKLGGGTLALTHSNSYSGVTLIKAGNISLGSGNCNQFGLGTGPGGNGNTTVTLDGGTLTMFSDTGSYDTVNWNLFVPASSTGTIYGDDRCNLYGSLTGGGTLNFSVNYVRTEFDGNWSAFTGQINMIAGDGSGDFRIGNTSGYGNATVNLGAGISAYHVSGSGVAIGALSGSAGSFMSGTPWTVGAKNTDSTFAGNITGNSLTKVGTGTLTFTGTNTYASGTTISGGTLQIGSGGTAGSLGTGSITDNATLVFNRSDSITDTSSGVISGTGNLAKRGAGRLALTKAHTYTGATTIETGTLALTNSGSIANSSNINVSAGALFDVSGTTSGSMTLANGKMISGVGSVKGNFTIGSGAKLAPGNSIGTLTFSNALTLAAGCTNIFEISKSPLTNDVARVFGALTSGGKLIVTNIGATALAAGDSFKLFNAAGYSGSFSAFILPALTNTLAWDTSTLNTNGTLKVIAATPPVFNSWALLGDGNFRLNFSGTANQPYEIRASTNIALTPITSWMLLDSGVFGGGAIVFDDSQATNFGQRYYLIRIP